MSEVIVQIILVALEQAILEAAKKYVTYYIRKRFDEAGRVITEIFYKYDSDGDGVEDSEQVFFTLDTLVPDLDNGFTLVNNGNELGLGYPSYRFLSSSEVLPVIQETDHISAGESICIDLDGDGGSDEVFRPVPYDGDGDGADDFEIIVDDDDNGIPDVSPFSPFYPIGSEGYQEIMETHSENVPALDKSFHNYTVSEALLFLIAFAAAIGVVSKIIRRRKL